ncbi:ion channel [Methylococcus sp. ANG]|uniref:ion channel n=1 Tax=Methylococcus sp. ANG TaxID=3231903 RepID=UPI00345996DA
MKEPVRGKSPPRRVTPGHLLGFGRGPHYYVYLLATLIVLLIISAVTERLVVRIVEQLIMIGTLISGTLATGRTPIQIALTVTAAFVMFVAGWARLFVPETYWLTVVWLIFSFLFFSRVTLALAWDIFSSRAHVSASLLYGAVSVYLLMGFTFANAHFLLETVAPGSYQCGAPQCHQDPVSPAYLYFSFVTLATVGYGDIVPLSRVAGMLAYMEAIAGQMYVAILVARLVGMQLSQSRD